MVDFSWRIGGEAGYGILSSGEMFSQLMKKLGYCVFSTTEYPSLIRGGNNTFTVRVSENVLTSHDDKIDILVALDELTLEKYKGKLRNGGVVVYNNILNPKLRKGIIGCSLPFDELSNKYGVLKSVMLATICIGASVKLLGVDKKILYSLLKERFKKKGVKVVNQNIEAVNNGYEYTKCAWMFRIKLVKKVMKDLVMIDGNTAVAMGAIRAGCKFLSSYPMTPATSIMQYFSDKQSEHNLLMHQAEDEISALNTALGASYAGVRSMVATSGGGFALMNEALSLAGCSETPIVIVLGQRPGPATGLPTRTEQGDLLYAVHAGHGDFQRIILAPGDVGECFESTINAFNLSLKYQVPVIILTDKYLGVSMQTINPLSSAYNVKKDEYLTISALKLPLLEKFKRYKITLSGVSPRPIPGFANSIHCSIGDEHDEAGYIIEGSEERKMMMMKRERKNQGIRNELFNKCVSVYGNKSSKNVIISWGSNKGIILEALKELDCKFVHVKIVHPFPDKELVRKVGEYNNLILVENNISAQLSVLIKANTGLKFNHKLLKFDGRAFNPVDIVNFVSGAVKNG